MQIDPSLVTPAGPYLGRARAAPAVPGGRQPRVRAVPRRGGDADQQDPGVSGRPPHPLQARLPGVPAPGQQGEASEGPNLLVTPTNVLREDGPETVAISGTSPGTAFVFGGASDGVFGPVFATVSLIVSLAVSAI